MEAVKVQYSRDGSLYRVPSMATKHVWLSTASYDSPRKSPIRPVMPYSGMCHYERGDRVYYRLFFNQSYFPIRPGKTVEVEIDFELVADYQDAKAVQPDRIAPKQQAARKQKAR